jgi:NAD+ synthase (glutamine-hydrolysing)
MRKYRIGGATVNQTPLDWKGNIQRLKEVLQEARQHKVEILCLPELSITGYGCEDLFLSDWLPKKALTFIPELIAKTDRLAKSKQVILSIQAYAECSCPTQP